jgi:WD40 repeat protein
VAAIYPESLETLEAAVAEIGDARPAAIVVDQLEELETAAGGDATRDRILDRISDLVEAPGGPWILATVRTDFLDRFLADRRFARLVEPGLVLVTPLEDHEVRDAVTRPAAAVGTPVDPDLTAAIVADAAYRVSALPLLEFALTDLYDRSGGKALTLEAYRAAGGITGSLLQRAEELYAEADDATKAAMRRLLLRLVPLAEDGEPVRRRRTTAAVSTIDGAGEVMDLLGRHRLLTFDRDAAGEPTVGVAHEALLTRWPRLRDWIDDARDSIRLHRRLADATAEWLAHDQSPAYLLGGSRLGALLARDDLDPTTEEQGFLERSRMAQSRARRRRAAVAWSLAAAFAVLAGVAWWQRGVADGAARHADVRRIAGEATLALAEDPERSILLALAAVDVSRRAGEPPMPEAVAALDRGVQTSRLEARLDGGALSVAFSPDGSLLATDMPDPETRWPTDEVVLWDVATGDRVRSLPAVAPLLSIENRVDDGAEGRALAFSPDGRMLAAASQSDPATLDASITVWDPGTGERLARLRPPGWVAWDPTWSGAGRFLTAASWDGSVDFVTTWDTATWQQVVSFRPGTVGAVAAYTEGTVVVTHGPEGRVGIYDVTTGEEVDAFATPGMAPVDVAVGPGGLVVLGSRHGYIQAWDVAARTMRWSRPVGSLRALAVGPDGTTVAAGGDEGLLRLIDLGTGTEIMFLPGPAGNAGIAFDPVAGLLASSHVTGAQVWDVSVAGPPALGAIAVGSGRPYMLDVSPDGAEVAASTWDGTLERRSATDGALLGSMDGLWTDPGVHPVVSGDWGSVALVTEEGAAEVRRLSTAEVVAALPPCTNPRALSPDGARVLVDGWWLCAPGDAPPGADLTSRLIDVASGAELLDLGPRNVFRAAFNPGGAFEAGRYLAVNYNDVDDAGNAIDGIDVIDTATGATVLALDISPTMIGFDPTGRYLAAGTYEGGAVVVDVAAAVEGRPMEEAVVFDAEVATGLVSGIALTGDGVLATAASESDFVRLWDVTDGALIVELRADLDGEFPPRLAFGPDGSYLLYPASGNVLHRYLRDTDDLVELAESRVTRALTDEECRRYLIVDRCP